MFGGGVAGDRMHVVEREQVAAAERTDRPGAVAAQAAQRQKLRAAARGGGGGTGREQKVRLAAAGGTAHENPRRRIGDRGLAQQGKRRCIGAGQESFEALLRRPAQQQRQLRAHGASDGGSRTEDSTTIAAAWPLP